MSLHRAWCPICGKVVMLDEPPWEREVMCYHGVPNRGLPISMLENPPRAFERLPRWHPLVGAPFPYDQADSLGAWRGGT